MTDTSAHVDAFYEANRRSWNEATRAHDAHKQDQAGALRRGEAILFPEELELLGPVAGRDLLHLQCNAGQDSLALAARGAVVTGVDLSDVAVDLARGLSAASGIEARFVRGEVVAWMEAAPPASFDLVFCSYGWLPWLADLPGWARGVARVLRPGGRLVTVEFHPRAMTLDEEGRPGDGRGGRPRLESGGVLDYVAASGPALWPWGFTETPPFANPHSCHEFDWGVDDLLGALAAAGLTLDGYREHPWSNGCRLFEGMRLDEERRWWPAEGMAAPPLMFSLTARRLGD